MNIGQTIKTIRLNKNIKVNNLYSSLLSRQAALKFESGASDTTVSKFLIILDRLNLSLEEFQSLYLSSDNKNFYYTTQYINLFYKKDIEALKSLSKEAEIEYKKTNLEKFNHYSALTLLMIDYLSNKEETNHLALKVIVDYLFTCEEWGYYEITLFTNSLIYIPSEFVDIVYPRVKKKFMLTENLLRYRNEAAIILFNILEKKILGKDVKKIKLYLTELHEIKDSTLDNMYIQTMIKYFTVISSPIINKDVQEDIKQQIIVIIDFFNFIELKSKAEQCQAFFERVQELYDF